MSLPTCWLIGSDTLLIQCGEILLERGFSIDGVITSRRRIGDWARTHNIEVISADSDYGSDLAGRDFDYLFAITHLSIIPDIALNAPKKLAINFHDGPLPRYAGLNAPLWALMKGERNYSITWHVITTGADAGDILLQQPVTIGDDDTGLSVNTKCFAAALESFPVLVDHITAGTLQRIPQDTSKRTYFSRLKRPSAACVLEWRRPAIELERLVRALHVGAYPNPVGSAKLLTVKSAVIVDSVSVELADVNGAPGTVISVDDGSIRVQTGDGVLCISGVSCLDGTALKISDAASRLGIAVGGMLPVFDEADVESLETLASACAKREAHWTRLLEKVEAVEMPHRSLAASGAAKRESRHILLPNSFREVAGHESGTGLGVLAFTLYLGRLLGKTEFTVPVSNPETVDPTGRVTPILSPYGYVDVSLNARESAWEGLRGIEQTVSRMAAEATWLRDLIAREPKLRANPALAADARITVALAPDQSALCDELAAAELLVRSSNDGSLVLDYSTAVYDSDAIDRIASEFVAVLSALGAGDIGFRELDLVGEEHRRLLLEEWNDTKVGFDRSLMMHTTFEQQVDKTPDAIAVVSNGQEITYTHLNQRANQLAAVLQSLGVGPDVLVGVHVGRSIELLVATLAVLKAGGAYVPLDPAFPADRLEFMAADSAMPVIISHSNLRAALPESSATVIEIDSEIDEAEAPPEIQSPVAPDNLAYVIYTSGSTGRPKGVMIEHRNVLNFFIAMDEQVPRDSSRAGVWLAVTSLSFDISVLELFWTLARGFKIIIHDEARTKTTGHENRPKELKKPVGLGLFMWGNDDAPGPAKYRLLMEGSRYFDENGFAAVWTPERHFHAFGGPYPNPSVTSAAVAAVTKNLTIRSGSCVLPLHHPVRVAEEWAVVDNLSDGRVELAIASGWNPNDFILRPESHANNKRVMFESIEQVRRLWRGERIPFPGPLGTDVEVTSLPRPVQEELTIWVTTAGNPETWRDAGTGGFNVLTHLLGQSVEEVGEKIQIYREARTAAGFDPDRGKVSLMLHTFVSEDNEDVRELVREPMKAYLASAMRLAMNFAWSFPAFKRPGGADSKPEEIDIKGLSDEEVDTILNFAFDRYFETSGLFGDVDTCLDMLARCSEIGVDEIACLLDFGVTTDTVMQSLPRLNQLRIRAEGSPAAELGATAGDLSFAGLVREHGVTHLQCTPSMARLYCADSASRDAMSEIPHLLVGGETLPLALAKDLKELRSGTLTNMYGPTETTIWSMTYSIEEVGGGVPIGKPIANTEVYILDEYRRLVPIGVPGELFIGGEGVARGYINRPEITAERFLANPFSEVPSSRIYATGDLASYRSDGTIDFIGRTDFQVKVRGYRIELGEIESVLEAQPGIREAVLVVRSEDASDQRLVAYVAHEPEGHADSSALRAALREKLPDYMVPNEIVVLDEMPRTANAKLDRKALQAMKSEPVHEVAADAMPTSNTEKIIADLWRKTLKLETLGVNENFFDLGGHSLLVVQLHNQLKQAISSPLSLTDLYQYPTIRSLSDHLSSGGGAEALQKGTSRGARRRALRKRSA